MTIQEWCSRTYNAFYGATGVTIYQSNEPPVRVLFGMIPDYLSNKEVQAVTVKEVRADTSTPIFTEIEVMCE